ncbi:MAG: FGGY-family carbohydrate kinase [Kiloniellaceae bacterium]
MAGANLPVFVGVDAGTTGVTVALFDAAGREAASGYQEYPCLHPHPGWVEQDMSVVWEGICKASRAAAAAAGTRRDAIRALGFSSQRGTFALLDKDERLLAPAVVWNDSRAKDMERVLAQRIDPDRHRAITGMPLSSSWACAKIAWLNRHRPDLMAKVRWIVNGQEYFLRRMGAEAFETDPASLTLNGMLDIRRLDWSDEILEAAGIARELLPPVGPPGAMVGRLSAEAAQAMGLPAGIPICRGAGDQQCAAVGAGVIRQGMAEITVGTAAMMVAHLDDPDLVTGSAPYIGGHGIAGKWDLEGGAFAIGSCLRWWRDNFAGPEIESAKRLGVNAYDLIVAQAATAPPGGGGAIFHPFFAGQVTPYYDVTARGGFFGLGLHHDRACMIRAILEGCSCEMRLMVEAFDRDLSGGIRDLRLTGGGTKSRSFVQIQADVLGRPVTLLKTRECTVLGAAVLAAVAARHFADTEAAVDAMVTVDSVVEPAQDVRSLYDELFGVFKMAYEQAAQSGLYRRFYDYQQHWF